MNIKSSKLTLGTANFGTKYGMTNINGRLSDQAIKSILSESKSANINMIDTAQAYGDSEARLGSFLDASQKVVTKIGIELEENYHENYLHNLVIGSMKRLNSSKIYGLLLHRPQVLFSRHGQEIISELNLLKEDGLVKKIGVSIYSPDILSKLLKLIELDIVQVPFNVFDQRVLISGWNKRLKDNNTEIHIRSVFLQGLLLMNQNNLHNWFELNWPELFKEWFEFQKQTNASADEIALGFGMRQSWVDKIVVGVDNEQQLRRLIKIEKANKHDFDIKLSSNDVNLIDPFNWKIK